MLPLPLLHLLANPGSGQPLKWPVFKWAGGKEDSYFARLGKNTISVYQCPDMGLLDKKSLKVDAVQDFEWWVGRERRQGKRQIDHVSDPQTKCGYHGGVWAFISDLSIQNSQCCAVCTHVV